MFILDLLVCDLMKLVKENKLDLVVGCFREVKWFI